MVCFAQVVILFYFTWFALVVICLIWFYFIWFVCSVYDLFKWFGLP